MVQHGKTRGDMEEVIVMNHHYHTVITMRKRSFPQNHCDGHNGQNMQNQQGARLQPVNQSIHQPSPSIEVLFKNPRILARLGRIILRRDRRMIHLFDRGRRLGVNRVGRV
jgi:hypothetical protein